MQWLKKSESAGNVTAIDTLKKFRRCANCGKEGAKKRCGGCKVTHYCDHDCSKQHWKTHKQDCKSSVLQLWLVGLWQVALRH